MGEESSKANGGTATPGRAKKMVDAASDLTRAPYVKGLPEWDMFPSEEARRAAIEEIESGMMPRSWRALGGFLLVVLPAILGPLFVLMWLKSVLIPQGFPHDDLVVFLGAALIYTVIIYFLLRQAMPRDLRKRLIRAGVPICMKCGYPLRGLPPESTRCPECGRKFSAAVRALVAGPTEIGAVPDDSPNPPVD